MNNPSTLAELATVLNEREHVDKAEIARILGDEQKAESVYKKATESMGRRMTGGEKPALLSFAEMSKGINKTMKELDDYIKDCATRIMPNTTYITDHKIAAELLARAGSMERLANMPASTVQLLGAEKALFKHIKFGSKPPKYGVIFKLPDVTNAQREKKGRIARTYAAKICIALKADYFSKNFIAEKLKAQLEENVKKITEKEIAPRAEQQQHGGFDRRGRGGQGNNRNQWQRGPPRHGRGREGFRRRDRK